MIIDKILFKSFKLCFEEKGERKTILGLNLFHLTMMFCERIFITDCLVPIKKERTTIALEKICCLLQIRRIKPFPRCIWLYNFPKKRVQEKFRIIEKLVLQYFVNLPKVLGCWIVRKFISIFTEKIDLMKKTYKWVR